MTQPENARIRKRLIGEERAPPAASVGELDIGSCATLLYSSEDADHPVDNLVDGTSGRGGTYWASARRDTTEQIELEFDRPERIASMIYEVQELDQERTQQVLVQVSADHGRSYRQVLAQDYTFSPRGATFQHEELRLDLPDTTNLRLTIVPNKGGSGFATLTVLRLFRPVPTS